MLYAGLSVHHTQPPSFLFAAALHHPSSKPWPPSSSCPEKLILIHLFGKQQPLKSVQGDFSGVWQFLFSTPKVLEAQNSQVMTGEQYLPFLGFSLH